MMIRSTRTRFTTLTLATLSVAGIAYFAVAESQQQEPHKWEVHDRTRPHPKVIQPGTPSTQEQPGKAPSDALVLFDGKDLAHWVSEDGSEPMWKVESGHMEAANKGLMTKEKFGDVQIHAEWSAPTPPQGTDQGRGNSGIYIMGFYEVQVLDSFENDTYADGQAAALYGQYPPLVNACLPPGMWQTYDIVFHAPQFGEGDKVEKPATVTVLHNGVLVQDHRELKGATSHHSPGVYKRHDEKLPIHLQFHGNPVRYRNFWVRELPPVNSDITVGAPKK
jgi:hypothetical protein